MTVCSSWSIFPFPLPSTLTISSIPASELQPSPSLDLHSRHGSLASLGIWYPNSRPAFHAALEGLSPSSAQQSELLPMRRLVFELIVLTAGLYSAVSVAQTLKQRPPAPAQQQNEDMP